MLTGKQRAYLRGLANDISPIFQIGKNGVEENFFNTSFTSIRSSRIN